MADMLSAPFDLVVLACRAYVLPTVLLAGYLESLLKSVPITARAESNVRQAMWDKLVFLGTLASITCLMRADIGTIMTADYGWPASPAFKPMKPSENG